ncbi:MAG: uracil phosphoribosyltransferase [Crocinitomicaceae bacterium]
MIHEIGQQNSIFRRYLAEIRDRSIQKDGMRFRKNMERISEILAYEVSKTFRYKKVTVSTPLGKKETVELEEQLVIGSILRAGLTMHQGILNYFDQAENAFISAYREESNSSDIKVHVEYLAAPDLNHKTLILADPMLATGTSMLLTLEAIQKNGIPDKIHILSAIASRAAVDRVTKELQGKVTLWIGEIDEELNDQAYIIPGLGDAGDLAFGNKL